MIEVGVSELERGRYVAEPGSEGLRAATAEDGALHLASATLVKAEDPVLASWDTALWAAARRRGAETLPGRT